MRQDYLLVDLVTAGLWPLVLALGLKTMVRKTKLHRLLSCLRAARWMACSSCCPMVRYQESLQAVMRYRSHWSRSNESRSQQKLASAVIGPLSRHDIVPMGLTGPDWVTGRPKAPTSRNSCRRVCLRQPNRHLVDHTIFDARRSYLADN